MKKIILLLIYGLFSVDLNAQDISKENFDKAVDFLNCKCVEFSLSHLSKNSQSILDSFHSTCDCEKNPNYNTVRSAIPSRISKTVQLSDSIDFIKNEFNTSFTATGAIRFLSDTIFNKKHNLKDFSRNDGVKELRVQIAGKLKSIVESPPAEATTSKNKEEPKSEVKTTEGETTQTKQTETVFFTLPIIIVLSLILLLFIIVFILISKVNSREVPEHVKYYIQKKIGEKIDFPRDHNNINSNSTNNSNRNLERQVQDLNTAISNLQKSVSDLEFKGAANKDQNVTKVKTFDEPVRTSSNQEIFFLSTPNSDGSFDKNDAKYSYAEGASIYRFVKTSNNRATFTLEENDDAIKRAIQYPDKRIDPVCEALNAFNPNAKRIKTETPGEAELVSDKWVVNSSKKAKIRYE